jgi:hypothetical protein
MAVKKAPMNSNALRLASIEASIRDIQEQMNENKRQMETLDRVIADLEEIKRNTNRKKKMSIFGKIGKKPEEEDKMAQVTTLLKNPVLQSLLNKTGKPGKGIDLSEIASLLQQPMIQSMLNPRTNKKKKGFGNTATGPGLSEMMNLLNNPMVQSLMKKI